MSFIYIVRSTVMVDDNVSNCRNLAKDVKELSIIINELIENLDNAYLRNGNS